MTRSPNYGWRSLKVGESVVGNGNKRAAAYTYAHRTGRKFTASRLPSGRFRIRRVK